MNILKKVYCIILSCLVLLLIKVPHSHAQQGLGDGNTPWPNVGFVQVAGQNEKVKVVFNPAVEVREFVAQPVTGLPIPDPTQSRLIGVSGEQIDKNFLLHTQNGIFSSPFRTSIKTAVSDNARRGAEPQAK